MTFNDQVSPRPRTSPLAVAAFCCSLGGLLFGTLASIAGIVLGFIALSDLKANGGEGRSFAIAAIWLGFIIGVGTLVLVAAILLTVLAVFTSIAVVTTQTGYAPV